jgi:GntR family transcriptional regulator
MSRQATFIGGGQEVEPALDRASPLPLYLQIRQRLVAEVFEWRDPALPFYSDDKLVERFGVSKMTVRQALRALVEQGLLTRTRARGTFVARRVFEERLTPSLDIAAQYEAAGAPQHTHLLGYGWEPAGEADLERFGATTGQVLVLERLRSVAGAPVAIDRRRIPEGVVGAIGLDETAACGSIIDILRTLPAPPVSADWTITIHHATAPEAGVLLVPAASPLLSRAMVYRTASGDAVLCGETLHRADTGRYRVTLPLA